MIITDRIALLDDALERSGIAHAFGGALALAWCTQQARGTIDIDVNVFVAPADARLALDALPDGIVWASGDKSLLERDGQTRLWWETTPVDIFLSTERFHSEAQARVRWEPFLGRDRPFLSCRDLAVFKAFFDRRRDWADLEDMLVARSIDGGEVAEIIEGLLGPGDGRLARLRALTAEVGAAEVAAAEVRAAEAWAAGEPEPRSTPGAT